MEPDNDIINLNVGGRRLVVIIANSCHRSLASLTSNSLLCCILLIIDVLSVKLQIAQCHDCFVLIDFQHQGKH